MLETRPHQAQVDVWFNLVFVQLDVLAFWFLNYNLNTARPKKGVQIHIRGHLVLRVLNRFGRDCYSCHRCHLLAFPAGSSDRPSPGLPQKVRAWWLSILIPDIAILPLERWIHSRTFKQDTNKEMFKDEINPDYEVYAENELAAGGDDQPGGRRISDIYDSMYDRMEETSGRKTLRESEDAYDRMYSLSID